MSLAGASGLIGTAVGLAVVVGVAGLAFKAVDRAIDSSRGTRKSSTKRNRNSGGFGGNDNIFDLGLTQSTPRKTRKKKFSQDFGSDFNIFAI